MHTINSALGNLIHCQGRSPLFHRLCSSHLRRQHSSLLRLLRLSSLRRQCSGFLRRSRLCRNKPFSQSPFRLPASSLKARNHLPQVYGQPLPDKEDAMNMVRHHLDGHHLYLRIIAMNDIPRAKGHECHVVGFTFILAITDIIVGSRHHIGKVGFTFIFAITDIRNPTTCWPKVIPE